MTKRMEREGSEIIRESKRRRERKGVKVDMGLSKECKVEKLGLPIEGREK